MRKCKEILKNVRKHKQIAVKILEHTKIQENIRKY